MKILISLGANDHRPRSKRGCRPVRSLDDAWRTAAFRLRERGRRNQRLRKKTEAIFEVFIIMTRAS